MDILAEIKFSEAKQNENPKHYFVFWSGLNDRASVKLRVFHDVKLAYKIF